MEKFLVVAGVVMLWSLSGCREDPMSHIVQIQTQVRDPVAIAAACQRLTLPAPAQRTAKLYDGQYTGWCVELPGWRYPLVCNTASGELKYDNGVSHVPAVIGCARAPAGGR
jgi:hypothetical protein